MRARKGAQPKRMIWTVLGLSVAIIAVFCVSVAELIVGHPVFESQRLPIAGALAATGLVLAMFGWVFRARRASRNDDRRSFILFDVRFWGPMLVVFGVITVFIRPLKDLKKEIALVPPRPAAAQKVAAAKPPSPEVPVKVPIVFPKVKIQGIFVSASRASAILNGESYFVGDHVGDAIVKMIDRNGVVLELGGETKLLTLN
jgi:hypothetical protein